MPLLGFTVFKEKIQDGSKRQTIRNIRKYPIKVGDTLYLYWKLRTKFCEFLSKETCTEEFIVSMMFEENWLHTGKPIWRVDIYYKDGNVMTMMDFKVEELAQKDGFNNATEMFRWFVKKNGPLNGNNRFQVIRW